MMTEEEAKKSFCPFMRDIVPLEVQGPNLGQKIPVGAVSANRYPDGRGTCCIGAYCMAWRWAEKSKKWVTDVPAHETGNDAVGHYEERKDRKGYCGLAGTPC